MDSKYKFHTIQTFDEGEMYKHVLLNKTLYIEEDGKVIAKLEDTEVMTMLEALGIADDFRKGFLKLNNNDNLGKTISQQAQSEGQKVRSAY